MASAAAQKAAARREAREAAKSANNAQADKDSALRKGNDKSPAPARQSSQNTPKAQAKSRKEQREEAQAKAEKQAEADALVKPSNDVPEIKSGSQPTLHQLNLQSKALSRRMRNEAREAAEAAGKATFEVLSGRKNGDAQMNRRFKTMATAQTEAALAAQRAIAENHKAQ